MGSPVSKEGGVREIGSSTHYPNEGICLGRALAPIHAMAQGMLKVFHGQEEEQYLGKGEISDNLGDQIQGTLEREIIVDTLLESTRGEARKLLKDKIDWLCEWIRNTDVNSLRKFLKWATGATCFSMNLKVEVGKGGGPLPRAHTCDTMIEISPERNTPPDSEFNDDTKEGFIHYLELAMAESQAFLLR